MAHRAFRCLALVASVIALWAVASPAGATRQQPASTLSSLERGVLTNINSFRQDHKLASLRFSSKLAAAAREHSAEMAQRGYFSHDSANGTSFDKRISRYYSISGKHYWSVGENIFWESPDTSGSSAVREWMTSAPHRQNILTREWREIGVAAAHFDSAPGAFGGRSVTIVTADFGVRR